MTKKIYKTNWFWYAVHFFTGCPVQACISVKNILKEPMVQCKCGRLWGFSEAVETNMYKKNEKN